MAGKWNTGTIWTSGNGGIGDYIHLHGKNYREYGINRTFGNNSFLSSATEAYQDLRNLVKQKNITQQKVDLLEESFNNLLYYNYQNAINKYSYTDEQIVAMEEALNASVRKHIGSATEWKRDDLSTDSRLKLMKTKYYGLTKSGQQGITIKKVRELINWAESYIQEVELYVKQAEVPSAQLNKLVKQQKELQNKTRALSSYLDIQTVKDTTTVKFNDSLRDLLNEIISFPSKVCIPNKQELGAIGESFAAAAALMIAHSSEEITEDMIEQALVGKNKSQTAMNLGSNFVDINYVRKGLNANLKNYSDHWKLTSGGLISGFATQDTIDVSIKLPDAESLFGLEELNMSIKNYKDTSVHGVHIISQAPLTAIFNLLDTNFVNHYLNLLAFNTDSDSGDASQSDFNVATNIVQYALAVRGLSGIREKTKASRTSDFFIVNNRTTNRISVFSTYDLLQRISPSMTSFDYSIGKVHGLPRTIGAIKKSNTWVAPINDSREAAIQQRIARIVLRAHSFKLSMSIKP